ncbi:hypothetical protein [Pseudomonas sp. NPDC089406]|uniref:hypothetical protein n=1 Tax=Pseudomonas sp. NPDC089406 TaxID=3364463 RepID=UPI00384F293D
MKKVNGVELIRGGKGMAACPSGTLCLYTHADYNQGETDGDILSIAPDIQLDQAQLRTYGFIVGGRSGVSCVVNKMNKAGALVSGADINGYTLNVAAGAYFSDLMGVTYPGGGTWNDKTHSVVSAPVQEVILKINLENDILLSVGETVETDLVIVNESSVSVERATVEFVSSVPATVEVGGFDTSVNIPSRNTATVRVPLTGRKVGNAQLAARLRMPVGLINNGDAEKIASSSVSKRAVNIRMSMAQQMEITAGVSLYYAPLEIKNESDVEIAGVVIESTSANTTVLTVGDFENVVTLPPNGSTRVNIPVSGIGAGNAVLTTKLSPPDDLVNNGDSQKTMLVVVHTRRDLRVDQSLLGKWKKVWDKPEFIYSYDLTLHSESIRVSRWRLSFILQQGAVLDPDWLETQKDWLEVDQALPGFVALVNKAGRTIEPGTDLKLAVQVLYPGESNYYNELYSLHLRQLE